MHSRSPNSIDCCGVYGIDEVRRGDPLVRGLLSNDREDSVGSARIASAIAGAGLAMAAVLAAGCASSAPHEFGQYNNLGPKVEATPGESMPKHITVQLDKAANVAVFLVVPGRSTVLLFPGDSTDDQHIQAGAHVLSTSLAGVAVTDSPRFNNRMPPTRSPVGHTS